MKKLYFVFLFLLAVSAINAQTITWNFTDSFPSTSSITNAVSSHVSRGNNNGTVAILTTTSVSSGYAGSSGTFNAGAAARTGILKLDSSAYFEVTVTPASGFRVNLTEIAFGSRSTGTGPRNYAIRTAADSFASNLFTDTLLSNSSWALKTVVLASTITSINPVTIRIYGYNGTGNPTSAVNWRIDDLKITGNTVVSSSTPPPSPVSALGLIGITKTSARVGFTKNVNYNPSTMKVLVFVKKDSIIIRGTPTFSSNQYTASTNLITPGTAFQNDVAARCVLKGDTNSVILTGLVQGSTYHLLAYVVSINDTLYSNHAIASGQTSIRPSVVTSVTFTSLGLTTAKIQLGSVANYLPTTHTKLVFLKKDLTITQGTPTVLETNYTANTNFSTATSFYQNDALAKCVLNGDDDSINVIGLEQNTTYHVLVFVFRNSDTTYSLPITANGQTDNINTPPLPVSAIQFSQVNTTSVTVNWLKPLNYDNSTTTTLVFAKSGSAISGGVNTNFATSYTANTVLGSGSTYQFDANAFCVFKGTGTSATINSLTGGTSYFFVVVNIKNDSVYSTLNFSQQTTALPQPLPLISVTFTGTSQNTARITWQKATNYNNASMSIMVFVKRGIILPITITKSVNHYAASPIFGNGTRYDSDSNAYCVFKGDTTFVNITNLTQETDYNVVVHAIRDTDSNASSGIIAGGTTFGPSKVFSIGQINKTNTTNGNPDSLNVKVTVRGTAYGFNQRASGLQFLLQDATGGITLYNQNRNFSYIVTEGDSLEATGTITVSRGLTQLTVDTLFKIASNRMLVVPQIVTGLNEQSENKLVRVNNVRFVIKPTGANWPAATTSIPLVSSANDTIQLRLFSTSGLIGTPLPASNTFSIVGLGAQFSSSFTAPFSFNGYQIIPRKSVDIIEVIDTLSAFELLTPANNASITVRNSNLADSVIITWQAAIPILGVALPEYEFELDTTGGDFQNPLVQIPSAETRLTITNSDIYDLMLDLGVQKGKLFKGIWRIKSSTLSGYTRYSTSIFTINLVNEFTIGLEDEWKERIQMYPNPANEFVFVEGVLPINLQLLSITGQVIVESNDTNMLSLNGIQSGIYLLHIRSKKGITVKKLIVE